MRGRGNLALLKQIVRIRGVQLAVAETEATRSASQMNDKRTIQSAHAHERDTLEEGWKRSVEMPSLRPDVAGRWAYAVQRAEHEVRKADADLARAKAKHALDAEAFILAQNLNENAQAVAARAQRKQLRHRDEIALQDASDLFLQRWTHR